ncbi:MAG: hypothetical protein EA403_08430 [Spirochaetaceae bacterium]|nr:MAG: hypothetical protein EA403_08430 [Spirochaetaceae bacterium]
MYRALFVSLLVLCAPLTVAPLTADPLWAAAVSHFARSRDIYASRMQTESAEFDGRGVRRSHREIEVAVSVTNTGEFSSRLLRARENGRDIAPGSVTTGNPLFGADAQDAGDEGRAASMAAVEQSPFDPLLQSTVSYTRVGSARTPGGLPAVEYRYTQTGAAHTISGTAWLNPQTGHPIALRASVTPLPRFVREMIVEQDFGVNENGWFTTEVRVRADGGFLFVRRSVHVDLRFMDHLRSPVPLKRSIPS